MSARWVRRIVILLLIVAAIVVAKATLFKPRPVPVTVYRVDRGLVEDVVTNSKAGTIETRKRAALSPEISGRVEKLDVRAGDRVQKGQLLLALNADDARAQLDLSRRALETALAAERQSCLAADLAAREHDRYLRLRQDGIVSEEILEQLLNRKDTSAASCEAARSQVQEARSAIRVAEVAMVKTRLIAPFDGIVADVTAEVGEWITPSPPGIMIPAVIEILDPSAIYVEAPLDEVDVSRVSVGQLTRISLDAYDERTFPGRVVRIAPFVRDEVDQNRTFDVEVEFDDADFARTLLPGTSADVEVILETRTDALRIPTYGLMEGNRVLIVEGDKLVARDVETGLRNWQYVEILAGLDEDEPVVVSLDRVEVQEGALAEIEDETKP